jgi:hypothetical protein
MNHQFNAGIFELRAVNLLAAALTQLDSESKSVINLKLEKSFLSGSIFSLDATSTAEVVSDFP